MRERARDTFSLMQRRICQSLETLDGSGKFKSDSWNRKDQTGSPGGGGVSNVLSNGALFEKGGVNFSEVYGTMPADLSLAMVGEKSEQKFYAVGTSLVIHPQNPGVPTIHANCRYLEVGSRKWFGGGIDLTPYVLFEDDIVHFHSTLKRICDRHEGDYYRKFKKWCDEYFYISHRKECRGVGGLFFDYLGRDDASDLERVEAFVRDIAGSFDELYLPIVEKRRAHQPTEAQRSFQLFRRGRYVEFNLVYDRGTLFGLKTDGRIESILMSLPPLASWEYGFEPSAGSDESKLMEIFRQPRDWVG